MQKFQRHTAEPFQARSFGRSNMARREERSQYGETVYLLEPNVKRSRGGLRDIQLLRWVGFARYGSRRSRQPATAGRAVERRPAHDPPGDGIFAALAQRTALPRRQGQRRARSGRTIADRRALSAFRGPTASCRSSSSWASTSATPRRCGAWPRSSWPASRPGSRVAKMLGAVSSHQVEARLSGRPARNLGHAARTGQAAAPT